MLIAAISLFLSAPAAFFFIKTPGEAGCPPYGAETQEKEKKAESVWGLTKNKAVRNPAFYLVWIIGMCYSISYSVQQYIAAFATMELRQSIAYGARAAAYMSFGFIISSMMLGFINDRFGAKAGLGYGQRCLLRSHVHPPGLRTYGFKHPSSVPLYFGSANRGLWREYVHGTVSTDYPYGLGKQRLFFHLVFHDDGEQYDRSFEFFFSWSFL